MLQSSCDWVLEVVSWYLGLVQHFVLGTSLARQVHAMPCHNKDGFGLHVRGPILVSSGLSACERIWREVRV